MSTGPAGVRRIISITGTGISKVDQLSSPKTNVQQKNEEINLPQESLVQNDNSNLFPYPIQKPPKSQASKIIPYMLIGLAGCGLLSGIFFLIGTALNLAAPSVPTMSVNQIVSTSVAQITQEALVNQMLESYTQTAASIQLAIEQTQQAPIEILPTDTVAIPAALDTPLPATRNLIIQPSSASPDLTSPGIIHVPVVVPQIINTEIPPPQKLCCKMCSAGKACGDSCISKSKTCDLPPGCACDS